ncbi:uncharacterized protein LOC123008103 [Tribolium madens]|uniref:uncharacterized protein LOC123008103 n=1 Tax=Tribolium madens TaxID=41895 RepID=UPI001CF72CAC|nr:uncharacterized protein LOC123008103 [Tribolium madens]
MNETKKSVLNKSLAKPLAATAGLLGLIQGIAWTIFAVLCISCYTGIIQIDRNENPEEYYKIIYVIFLNESTNTSSELLIKPQEFLIFMCFYVVFSVIWLCISGSVIWAMIHNQWHLTKCLFGGWSTTTFIICIVDIVLTSLLGRDYARIEDKANLLVLVCYGIVMSLACRGYVLWVVNLVFATILLKFTIKIVLKENEASVMPIIHGYESNNTPPWFNDSDKDLWSSPPKSDGYDNQGFTRSDSFLPASTTQENVYSLPNSEAEFDNENFFSGLRMNKTAKIGKHKSNWNRVEGPIIPDPDYSPPNTPKSIKSVLRSKSNYD